MRKTAPAEVSVVIISKHEAALDETLQTLERECEATGAECLVVDASEGTLDWIREKHPWVGWVEYRPSISGASSIPEQRNVGVSAAAGRIIVFCDSGGVPEAGWLQAIVGPILAGKRQFVCGPVTSRRAGVYRTINDVPEDEVVASPPTANVAFTRTLFEQVGGFDERYGYGSDVDFAWRCAAAGEAPRCARGAVMTMDWGPWALQKRRSWRYGRARARLCRIHKGAWRRILREQPEIVAYPVAQVATAKLLTWSVFDPRFALAGALLGGGAAAALRVRNRKSERPWAVMLGHVIYGWAYWFEIVLGPRWRKPRIDAVHSPVDEGGPYVESLVAGLRAHGVSAIAWRGPTRSAAVNLLIAPVLPLWWRWKGARIWHLHWTWGHTLPYLQTATVRRIERAWLTASLKAARAAGMQIIWTAHNLYPHSQVFDDDKAARRTLCVAAATVIAHDEEAGARIAETFEPKRVRVIEQGAIDVPRADRDEARRELGVEDAYLIVGFGKIARYKGYHTLLHAVEMLEETLRTRTVVRIVGECGDEAYLRELRAMAGERVTIEAERVSEEALGALLAAADACAFLFEASLNSSTRKTAGRAGVPSVVRGTHGTSGEWLVEDATGAARALEAIAALGPAERAAVAQARIGAHQHTWYECAKTTAEAYREAVRGT
jgi:glycosyltransferase involved in cell wall biosynthesis